MWQFIEEKDGILYFTKDQMTRNTVGDLSQVQNLIDQWNTEDLTTQEEE